VAVLTYRDQLSIGVTADYASAPEARQQAGAIEAGIAELVAECPGPTGRGAPDGRRPVLPGFPGLSARCAGPDGNGQRPAADRH
jgi:hypothetical protein